MKKLSGLGISDVCKYVLKKLMANNPEKRFSTKELLDSEWIN